MTESIMSGSPVPVPRDTPLLRAVLGAVLRRIRLEQGRTLAEVATDARVSMQYLSELERGRKEASSEVLAAICAALRIDLADLLTDIRSELAVDGALRGGQVVRLAGSPGPVLPRHAGAVPLGPGDVVCRAA
ncbi:MAG: helix-turn-helix domain-containing protein [Streptosporangiaceae bacterium]